MKKTENTQKCAINFRGVLFQETGKSEDQKDTRYHAAVVVLTSGSQSGPSSIFLTNSNLGTKKLVTSRTEVGDLSPDWVITFRGCALNFFQIFNFNLI